MSLVQLEPLTPREHEVLELMCRGHALDRELAKQLVISELTAHYHVRNIMRKLDCRSRLQLVILAFTEGLLEPRLQEETV